MYFAELTAGVHVHVLLIGKHVYLGVNISWG